MHSKNLTNYYTNESVTDTFYSYQCKSYIALNSLFFMIKIKPLDVILWTFRRNENDIVNLYNVLSPMMQLASGGNMLNFGYWDNNDVSPIMAQNKLCDLVGNMAELDSAKSLLDIGSGLSSPALRWASSYPKIEIACVNINYLQLQAAKNHLKQGISNFSIYEINSTSTMLPFSKNSADRIIALESAQHFKPFKDFISESNRILKKDGILTFAIPVTRKKSNIKNLGMLSFTWPSEHYDKDFIIRVTSKKFDVIEKMEIGSHVFEPLTDYYVKNRTKLQDTYIKTISILCRKYFIQIIIKNEKGFTGKIN